MISIICDGSFILLHLRVPGNSSLRENVTERKWEKYYQFNWLLKFGYFLLLSGEACCSAAA